MVCERTGGMDTSRWGGGRSAKTVYGYWSIGGLRVKHDGSVRVYYVKESYVKERLNKVQPTLL